MMKHVKTRDHSLKVKESPTKSLASAKPYNTLPAKAKPIQLPNVFVENQKPMSRSSGQRPFQASTGSTHTSSNSSQAAATSSSTHRKHDNTSHVACSNPHPTTPINESIKSVIGRSFAPTNFNNALLKDNNRLRASLKPVPGPKPSKPTSPKPTPPNIYRFPTIFEKTASVSAPPIETLEKKKQVFNKFEAKICDKPPLSPTKKLSNLSNTSTSKSDQANKVVYPSVRELSKPFKQNTGPKEDSKKSVGFKNDTAKAAHPNDPPVATKDESLTKLIEKPEALLTLKTPATNQDTSVQSVKAHVKKPWSGMETKQTTKVSMESKVNELSSSKVNFKTTETNNEAVDTKSAAFTARSKNPNNEMKTPNSDSKELMTNSGVLFSAADTATTTEAKASQAAITSTNLDQNAPAKSLDVSVDDMPHHPPPNPPDKANIASKPSFKQDSAYIEPDSLECTTYVKPGFQLKPTPKKARLESQTQKSSPTSTNFQSQQIGGGYYSELDNEDPVPGLLEKQTSIVSQPLPSIPLTAHGQDTLKTSSSMPSLVSIKQQPLPPTPQSATTTPVHCQSQSTAQTNLESSETKNNSKQRFGFIASIKLLKRTKSKEKSQFYVSTDEISGNFFTKFYH